MHKTITSAMIATAALGALFAGSHATAQTVAPGGSPAAVSAAAGPTVATFTGWGYSFSPSDARSRAYAQAVTRMESHEASRNRDCRITNSTAKTGQAGGGLWQVSVKIYAWCYDL
jgi:hypothetical protein